MRNPLGAFCLGVVMLLAAGAARAENGDLPARPRHRAVRHRAGRISLSLSRPPVSPHPTGRTAPHGLYGRVRPRATPTAAPSFCCMAGTSRRAIGTARSKRSPAQGIASSFPTRSASTNPPSPLSTFISISSRAIPAPCSILCLLCAGSSSAFAQAGLSAKACRTTAPTTTRNSAATTGCKPLL